MQNVGCTMRNVGNNKLNVCQGHGLSFSKMGETMFSVFGEFPEIGLKMF